MSEGMRLLSKAWCRSETELMASSSTARASRFRTTPELQRRLSIMPSPASTLLQAPYVFFAGNIHAGVSPTGTVTMGNGLAGIALDAADSAIGSAGTTPVISGNVGEGLVAYWKAARLKVCNVRVGVGPDGMTSMPNGINGVAIFASFVTIGCEARSVIGSNGHHQIFANRRYASPGKRERDYTVPLLTDLHIYNVFVGVFMDGSVICLLCPND